MKDCHIDGLVKTVRASEVERWSQEGWVVVGSYQDTLLTTIQELADMPIGSQIHNRSDNGWTDAQGHWQPIPLGKTVVYKHIPETITFFVLQKNSEGALAELSKSLELAKSELETAKADHDKKIAVMQADWRENFDLSRRIFKESEDTLEKKLKETEDALKDATSDKKTEILNKRIQKLEADLEKAQRALETAQQEHFGVRRVDLTEDT
jgi:hypothetical protein